MLSSGENRRLARARILAAVFLALAVAAANAFAQLKETKPRAAASPATDGKQIFSGRCAGCHGLDGSGSQRAPDIARSGSTRRLSDSELAHVILNGRTDFGMPSFRALGERGVERVVEYLRVLQGKGTPTAPIGNAQYGKALFFGKAECSSCHSMGRQAGFAGSDLSQYSRGLTPVEIRKAIISPTSGVGRSRAAVVTTSDGHVFNGTVKNEDNFSVQMQSKDGTFHFLMKSDIAKLEYQHPAPMPVDFGKRLDARELDNLVEYLRSVKSESWNGDDE